MTRTPWRTLGALALLCVLAGCALPSGWRPWGTPLTKVEKRETQETNARGAVLDHAQAAVHQAVLALDAAPPGRAVTVASDFASEAQALLDQAQGAPLAGDVQKWQTIVTRLLSENAEVRAGAEREREKARSATAEMAEKLAGATAARVRAEQQVREYAKDNERLADMIRRVVWIGGGLAALWLAGQVLTIAARFNPALSGIAGAVNMVAAPAVQYAAARAQTGLARVGEALAQAREQIPDAAKHFTMLLNEATDRDHQQHIASAAKPS